VPVLAAHRLCVAAGLAARGGARTGPARRPVAAAEGRTRPRGESPEPTGNQTDPLAGRSASNAPMVVLTHQHTNHTVLVEGPEIMIRPVGSRRPMVGLDEPTHDMA
jgi:hypothetical protein